MFPPTYMTPEEREVANFLINQIPNQIWECDLIMRDCFGDSEFDLMSWLKWLSVDLCESDKFKIEVKL